ncbi:MAG: SDR family NAD(P)-dependent oxidoreductase [Spirochaetota bacterium]
MAKGQERDRNLEGRRALVVGGSGGIGHAVAKGLASRGADLVITGGSDPDRLEATVSELRRFERSVEGFLIDIGRANDLLSQLGDDLAFDILVLAFGPFMRKSLDTTSVEDWEYLSLLNLALPGALASALLPGMIKRGWGRLVFFGGTGTDTIKGFRTNAAYAAAKTGLGVLAKSIALEYADFNIASFVLCPGLVDTEYLSPALRAELSAKSPRGLLLSADAIGESAAFLAADDPCLASGAQISLDGGLGFRN